MSGAKWGWSSGDAPRTIQGSTVPATAGGDADCSDGRSECVRVLGTYTCMPAPPGSVGLTLGVASSADAATSMSALGEGDKGRAGE